MWREPSSRTRSSGEPRPTSWRSSGSAASRSPRRSWASSTEDVKINILDTPGHEDFAEDTYRTLTAVDSVIIVIDGAKGVETQTRKLMEVCRMRNTPVMVFVNKLDRPCKDPFDLLDEIERELKIQVRPLAWPISTGPTFKGVYDLYADRLSLFFAEDRQTAEG